ncbi:MAG TPA: peptidoglycan DD-metalloendopeptidase family protein [Chloroflexi bacterium]|nr:peptidoglycan DD-metalloendopeptidase family protein [Chloroflexota bacterium]
MSFNDIAAGIRRALAAFDSEQESDSSAFADAGPSTGQQTEQSVPILTHTRGTAQVIVPATPKPKATLPMKNLIRGGVAAAVLVSGGWLLWSQTMADASDAPAPVVIAANAAAPEPGAILGLRPTFTPTPRADATPTPVVIDTSELAQIVIVTPTPDPRRALTVAGAVIDRPLAVAELERANVGLAGLLPISVSPPDVALQAAPVASTFDLVNLRIPPMIEEVSGAPVPQVQIISIDGVQAEPVEEVEEATPILAPEPVAAPVIPENVNNGPTRAWSSFQPKPPEENDHFWVESPFLNTEYNKVAAPSYQFGSTAGGQYRPHHGIDIANYWGTPVQAGTTGTVVFAGLDDPTPMGPYPNFYGNTVVIKLDRKLPVAGGELDAFVLYGHLSRVTVAEGQRVAPTDIVGEVGMTGIAIGPHLHFEMRVGENTYQNSVNPYLWLKPAPGEGVVAVRLITADGRSWPGARLTLARFENGRAVWGRLIETYLDNEGIGPNPSWGENGAMGDVPAGYYVLIGNVNGEAVRAEFFVREGQTTFVEIRTKQ